MKTIKYFIIVVLVFLGIVVYSQDPSFSQFYGNQTYFNPAYVGIHGGMMVNTTYRRQWLGVPSKFSTQFFNFDSDLSCINGLGGFGISVYHDVEGLVVVGHRHGGLVILGVRRDGDEIVAEADVGEGECGPVEQRR